MLSRTVVKGNGNHRSCFVNPRSATEIPTYCLVSIHLCVGNVYKFPCSGKHKLHNVILACGKTVCLFRFDICFKNSMLIALGIIHYDGDIGNIVIPADRMLSLSSVLVYLHCPAVIGIHCNHNLFLSIVPTEVKICLPVKFGNFQRSSVSCIEGYNLRILGSSEPADIYPLFNIFHRNHNGSSVGSIQYDILRLCKRCKCRKKQNTGK